jgi:small subunit ribosomal protein S16
MFRLVVVPKRGKPKRGKYIEMLGWMNPVKHEYEIQRERVKYWISVGAKPSATAWNLFVREGIVEGPKRPKGVSSDAEEQPKEAPSDAEGRPKGVSSDAEGQPKEAPSDAEGQPKEVSSQGEEASGQREEGEGQDASVKEQGEISSQASLSEEKREEKEEKEEGKGETPERDVASKEES